MPARRILKTFQQGTSPRRSGAAFLCLSPDPGASWCASRMRCTRITATRLRVLVGQKIRQHDKRLEE
jgi:hypothetical protein